MAGINRSTYLEPHEDAAVQAIGTERKWSMSQTIAELVRESPTFRRAHEAMMANQPKCTPAVAGDNG